MGTEQNDLDVCHWALGCLIVGSLALITSFVEDTYPSTQQHTECCKIALTALMFFWHGLFLGRWSYAVHHEPPADTE